jgi:creatinine amidohydrolase/Fe(II)-dependent formamide hydrolase-like protein
MLLSIHPELVHMERAEAGYTGDLQQGIGRMFESGVKALSENGAIGDPAEASPEHGERYWDVALDLVLEQIEAAR